MADRIFHEQHKARYRGDRSDQRRPTFQIINAVQPKVHSHGKREFYQFIEDQSAADHLHSVFQEDSNPPNLQKRLIGVHTISNKSCESVTSRSPACNFNGAQFQSNNNNRSRSVSPGEVDRSGRPRSQSPQDRVVMDEPSDLVVWNPSKKTSRSNLLCPLTDSEYRNINFVGDHNKNPKNRNKPRHRSTSVPAHAHQHNQYKGTGMTHPELKTRNDVLFNVDNLCKEATEMLDDFVAPPMSPSQLSPSVSLASTTYSMQISLVTQQLEEIQQAQNDVLKHLGEEISKVTTENERLRKEVEHVRDQNEGLIKYVHERTDELERMKQIFLTRNLPHPQSQAHNEGTGRIINQDEDSEDNDVTLPKVTPASFQLQQPTHQRPSSRQEHPQRSSGRKRDSVNSNASHKSHSNPPTHTLGNAEAGDNPYLKHSPDLSSKPPKSKKAERKKPDHGEGGVEDAEARDFIDDDNLSYISTDSHLKGSGRRRSRNHSHGHQQHSHKSNSHNNHHTPQQPRSRSKERRGNGGGRTSSKSPRSSNCYEQGDTRVKPVEKPVYPDDCNDDYESRGGCFRFFCCGSNSNTRSRTDFIDEMALNRGCPE